MRNLVVTGMLVVFLLSAAAPTAPAQPSPCQPVRAVFYTSDDWLQLAQGLAADPSACAQYYISIPPPAANKTQVRPNAATASTRSARTSTRSPRSTTPPGRTG